MMGVIIHRSCMEWNKPSLAHRKPDTSISFHSSTGWGLRNVQLLVCELLTRVRDVSGGPRVRLARGLRVQTSITRGAGYAVFTCVFSYAEPTEDHAGQDNPHEKTASTLGEEQPNCVRNRLVIHLIPSSALDPRCTDVGCVISPCTMPGKQISIWRKPEVKGGRRTIK